MVAVATVATTPRWVRWAPARDQRQGMRTTLAVIRQQQIADHSTSDSQPLNHSISLTSKCWRTTKPAEPIAWWMNTTPSRDSETQGLDSRTAARRSLPGVLAAAKGSAAGEDTT